MKNTFFHLCLSLFLVVQVTFAQNLSLPKDSEVKVGKLSNGLTYYIRKNQEPGNKVELRLVVNAGSMMEDDDQQGLAHFVEHMAFNGTKHFKKNDLVSYLQSIGVQFGSDLNAYTGFDETVYILPIPTDKKDNIEKGFQILQDWAGGIAFDSADINGERTIILEELRAGKGADDRIFKKTFPVIYNGTQYPQRIPGGSEEIIKNFKPETIKRFYKDWYRPNLMAVIAVGDVNPAEIKRYIHKYFGKLINPDKERSKVETDFHPFAKTSAVIATDPEASSYEFEIHMNFKTVDQTKTESDFRQSFVRSTARGMLSWRLSELYKKPNGPLQYAHATIDGYARGFEHFNAYAIIGNAGIRDAVTAVVQELVRVREQGFTRAEFERMILRSKNSNESQYMERDKFASAQFVEEYVRNFLQHEPIPGIEFEYEFKRKYYASVTLEEINKTIAELIPAMQSDKILLLKGPATGKFTMPSQDELLQMVRDAVKVPIKPYEDQVVASELFNVKLAPATIKTETINPSLGITDIMLSNQVRVILKPTDFNNDLILMTSSKFGGQSVYENKDRANAYFASSVVRRAGVSTFSRADLEKILAGKEVSVTTDIGQVSQTATGYSRKSDFEALLQLTYLKFTAPRWDTASYASLIKELKVSYSNLKTNPQLVFNDSVNLVRYGAHPWAPLRADESTLAQLNESRMYEIYRERFGNAAGTTFVFVGAFNVEDIKPLITKYLGNLPSSDSDASYRDVGLRPVKGPLKKEFKIGQEQKSLINLYWNGETTYSDNEALAAAAFAAIMDIKLTEVLREQIGGVYSGGLYGGLNNFPYDNYIFKLYLPTGPEHVEKLIAASLGEIEKIKKEGPRKEDLEKVKQAWRQSHKTEVSDNGFWLEALMRRVNMGSDLNIILQYEERVNKLTAKEVQEVAKRYLDSNYVQIIMSPEK